MGNFLIVIPDLKASEEDSERVFQSGLDMAAALKHQEAGDIIRSPWVSAALFPRRNGSGAGIAKDPESETWLFSIGTWFHTDGYSSGDELRLLRSYQAKGAEQVALDLEGFFVILIGDGRTRETVLITDIVGSCHSYFRKSGHTMALSGSPLVLAALEKYSLDSVACQEFFNTGAVFEDRTIFQEVRALFPATIHIFSPSSLPRHIRYWSMAKLDPEALGRNKAVPVLAENLIVAANKIGKRFRSIVCDLTGGYDSRALVAAFASAGVPFATTVTGPPDSRDVIVSKGLASIKQFPHRNITPEETEAADTLEESLRLTDGGYDAFEYARVCAVHQILSRDHDISLNGSYGEVSRGYWWELLFPKIGSPVELDAAKVARCRFAVNTRGASLFHPHHRVDLAEHFAGSIKRANAGLAHFPNTSQMDHAYIALRMRCWQGRIASSTNQLWPCLSPFMFRTVLETMLQMPYSIRRRSLAARMLIQELQPAMASYPMELGHPAEPCRWSNLYRFSPLFRYYFGKATHKILSKVALWDMGGKHGIQSSKHRRETPEEIKIKALWKFGLDEAALFDAFDVDLRALFSDGRRIPDQVLWTRLATLILILGMLKNAVAQQRPLFA